MTSLRPVWSSASRSAISLASVPEFVKKLFSQPPGARRASFAATSTIGWVGKSVETCWSVSTCSWIARFTSGWQCPRPTVTIPPKKSRYRFPSASQTCFPCPRTMGSGSS